jgi:hypothetical protein
MTQRKYISSISSQTVSKKSYPNPSPVAYTGLQKVDDWHRYYAFAVITDKSASNPRHWEQKKNASGRCVAKKVKYAAMSYA